MLTVLASGRRPFLTLKPNISGLSSPGELDSLRFLGVVKCPTYEYDGACALGAMRDAILPDSCTSSCLVP